MHWSRNRYCKEDGYCNETIRNSLDERCEECEDDQEREDDSEVWSDDSQPCEEFCADNAEPVEDIKGTSKLPQPEQSLSRNSMSPLP